MGGQAARKLERERGGPLKLELFKNRVGIQPSTSALNSAASTVGGSLETQPQLQRSRIGLDVPPGLAEEDEASGS